MRDLRLAVRTLLRAPIITIVALVSLALGIGANAAIYSLFNEMMLAPLSVPRPDQLVLFGGNDPSPGSHSCGTAGNCRMVFSYRTFRDLEAQPGPFSGVAAHQAWDVNIAVRGNTLAAEAEVVSGSYFPVLGIKPTLGRLIGLDDDKVVDGNPVAVLGHAYWETQLGSDPAVVGQHIMVNGHQFAIIGVAPAGFEGTTVGIRPDAYIPLTMRAAVGGNRRAFDDRTQYWAYLFARLKPGVTMQQAGAQENALYHSIINTVEVPLQQGLSDRVMARFKAKTIALSEGARGSSDLARQTEGPLALLLAITMVVLAIACANIANLLLARAASRSIEMAVRLSLGATRRQLLAQLLTESMLLAVLGGVTGLAVAYLTLKGMATLLPADLAQSVPFTLSGRAVAFAGCLSIMTGLLFGLFPALHSTRPNLVAALRDGSGKTSATRAAARFRSSLVTAQIALSMTLLVSAGLFIESLVKISRVSLGVATEGVMTFHVAPALNGYRPARSAQVFADLERDLAAIPGVRAVAPARVPIIGGHRERLGEAKFRLRVVQGLLLVSAGGRIFVV